MRALALVLLCACSRTTVLATSSTALLIVDWRQSQGIVEAGTEINPFIGPRGERVPVNVYFPTVIALHLAVGLALPGDARTAWFAGILGAQASTTWGNARRE